MVQSSYFALLLSSAGTNPSLKTPPHYSSLQAFFVLLPVAVSQTGISKDYKKKQMNLKNENKSKNCPYLIHTIHKTLQEISLVSE